MNPFETKIKIEEQKKELFDKVLCSLLTQLVYKDSSGCPDVKYKRDVAILARQITNEAWQIRGDL